MNGNDKSILEANWNYRAARVLHVANNLQIFTLLFKKPMSVVELADTCSAKGPMLEKLLIACCAMGLLKKHQEIYSLTNLSATYLVAGRELYQGDMIAHSANKWDFWTHLEDEILQEKSPPADDKIQHQNFIRAMHNITMSGRGDAIVEVLDLSGRKQLFDVGGGPGVYSILFCRRWPELKAVVFDLPETIAIAQEIIDREQMADRISVREGSWDSQDFGLNNDVVLLSNILHGPESRAEMKLAKAYDSLVSGGLVLIQDFLLNDEKTGPLLAALFNIMVGAFSQKELFTHTEQAGFIQTEILLDRPDLGATWISGTKP
jgi:predicted O-methyltransferase YrrM